MNNRRRDLQATDDELLALVEPVRRVALSRTRDSERADDVVQEALARTLAARHRLDRRALPSYAISVARNLVADEHRDRAMAIRHAPRLYEPDGSELRAEELIERREEVAALGGALAGLSEADRTLLLRKEIDGRDLADLANSDGTSAAALAARMARVRARVRVDYLLNLRRITLPSHRCRAVLVTLSSGQQRRQRAASVKEHLDSCSVCAPLAPLVEARRRPLAAVVPVPLVLAWEALRRFGTKHPWHAAAAGGAGTAVAAGALGVVLHQPPPPPTPPQRPAVVTVHARVVSAPADEGFWIARAPGRTWVQMTGPGESRVRIRTGETVSFTGRLIRNRPGFAHSIGLPPGPDATALDRAGSHLEVAKTQVRVG